MVTLYSLSAPLSTKNHHFWLSVTLFSFPVFLNTLLFLLPHLSWPLSVRSCFHFKIMGDVCLFKAIFLMSVILWGISSFPTVFIYRLCLVKCSLCISLSITFTIFYVVTSLLTQNVVGRSCLSGAFTTIIIVCFLCFTKFKMCTRPFSDSFFAMLFVPPQTTTMSSFVNPPISYFAVFVITSSRTPGLT